MKPHELKFPLNKPIQFAVSDDGWWDSQSYCNGYHAGLQGAMRSPDIATPHKEMWLMGYDDAQGNLELIKDDV